MSLNSFRAKSMSSANNDVIVYTAPATKQFANVSLNLVNTGSEPAKIRVGITSGNNIEAVNAIEYGLELASNGGQLRRTSLFLAPGENLIVWSDKSTVAVRATGLEQNGTPGTGKGKLGGVLTEAATNHVVYEGAVTGLQFASAFILAVNTNSSPAEIDVSVGTSTTPGSIDFINKTVKLDANGGTYEYPCAIVHPGERVIVRSSTAGVAVRVHGLEEA